MARGSRVGTSRSTSTATRPRSPIPPPPRSRPTSPRWTAPAPAPRHDVYVCTNISCSLRGADELFAAMREAAEGNGEVNVREFECLGACDIAPMASVDGVYVGPLEPADARAILDDLSAGRPVLADKQLLRRPVADPEANSREFPRPDPQPAPSAFARSAGPPMEGDAAGP